MYFHFLDKKFSIIRKIQLVGQRNSDVRTFFFFFFFFSRMYVIRSWSSAIYAVCLFVGVICVWDAIRSIHIRLLMLLIFN